MQHPSNAPEEPTPMAAERSNDHARVDRMRQTFDGQRRAFLEDGLVTAGTRIDRLNRVRQMIGA